MKVRYNEWVTAGIVFVLLMVAFFSGWKMSPITVYAVTTDCDTQLVNTANELSEFQDKYMNWRNAAEECAAVWSGCENRADSLQAALDACSNLTKIGWPTFYGR